jgi:hypothetical protein
MKNSFFAKVTLLGVLALAFRAQAKTGGDLSVEVPQSGLEIQRQLELPSLPQRQAMEFDISNWSPSGSSTATYLNSTSAFRRTDVPRVSLSIAREGWKLGPVLLSTKYGLAYSQMERDGQIVAYGQSSSVSQQVNLFSARIGMEVTPQRQFFGFLQPFAAASFLPTWGQAAADAFDDGISSLYFGVEGSLGVAAKLPKVAGWLGVQSVSLEIGVEATDGLKGAPLNGSGALAGTRIEL